MTPRGRPEVLWPLFGALSALDGIGPKTETTLSQAGIEKPRDLLFTLPVTGIDRAQRDSVLDVRAPMVATVEVTIGAHQPPSRKGRPYRVMVEDARTAFEIVYFHARGDYLSRLLPTGQRRIVSGKIELFDGMPRMTHPDHVVAVGQAGEIPSFEPVYPLHGGVTQKLMWKATGHALSLAPDFAEWIDPDLRVREGWPAWVQALKQAHRPGSPVEMAATAPARARLAYDEVLAHQVTLTLARATARRKAGRETIGTGLLRAKVMAQLPYSPTGAQTRAVEEIAADMATPSRMNRLLQGDVGAGKTLVALMALLVAVEAGGQGVMMAPTEVLARQHQIALVPLAKAAGVRVVLFTGRDKGRERQEKLAAIATGEVGIVVGTHAVFQKDVHFHDLRLAVIDEQHRFGVAQRMELGAKGRQVDVLVMTATPIPRSLSLAQYGDMDISVLDEKPPGRQPVTTAIISNSRIGEVVERLGRAVAEGRQAYWVCPLVEESDVTDMTAAEARFARLRAALGDEMVGLVHGQLPPGPKGRRHGKFRRRSNQGAGCDDGYRGGRRCAECVRNGD